MVEDPSQRAKLDGLIARVRTHPALYCYFVTDEPNATNFAGLGKLVAHLRERDPAHGQPKLPHARHGAARAVQSWSLASGARARPALEPVDFRTPLRR